MLFSFFLLRAEGKGHLFFLLFLVEVKPQPKLTLYIMRKEPFTVGDYIHVYNRGSRKQPIVCDAADRWRFLQMLYYFNNEVAAINPFKDLRKRLGIRFSNQLIWPKQWPRRKPLVKIIAFTLMRNHFHFLFKEIKDGGITSFMRKLGTGMTSYFNLKYQQTGRLFQSSYKAKVIRDGSYLVYLSVYIQVKNSFELYPEGFKKALQNFDKAFDWVIKYPYCSLGDYAGKRNSPIIDKDILGEMFQSSEEYKSFAKDCILSMNLKERVETLIFED